MKRVAVVIFVAALMAVSPIAGVAASAGTAGDLSSSLDADTNTSGYEDVRNTHNDNISVWERTPLPLRSDKSVGDTTIRNQQVAINDWEDRETQLWYEKIAVYDNGTTIPLDFEGTHDAPIDQFEDDTASVVVGKLDPDADADDAPSDLPMSVAEFQELFADDGLDELNDNVTFKEINTTGVDDGFSTTFTPDDHEDEFGDGVGQYVVLAAIDADSETAPNIVDEENDALDPQDHAIFVGVEGLLVHETTSSVDVGDAEAGDDVTFQVDANIGEDGEVHHAVALYHEDTFDGATTTLNLTAEPDENFTAEDLIVESEIGEINGVANLDDEAPLLGGLLGNASHSGTVDVRDVLSFLEGEFDQDAPEFVGGEETLDASVVSLADANVTEEITVETFDNWTAGEDEEYQWVHVAATADGETFSTSGDTITIEEDVDPAPGLPPAPPAPPEPGHDFELVETEISAADVAVGEKFEVRATFRNVGDEAGTETIELTRDGEVVAETDVTLEAGEKKTVTFDQSIDEEGQYEYAVNGVTVGTVNVIAPGAEFQTTDASLSDLKITTGDGVDVAATVENVGGSAGTHTAQLVVDGDVVDEVDVTLDAGTSETVAFTHTFEDAGEYDVSVDDAFAGTVTVEDEDDGVAPSTVWIVLLVLLTLAVMGGAAALYTGRIELPQR